IQVSADLLFATGIVWLTGWGESSFIITYSLAIIAAALLLQTRGALIVAATASGLFLFVVLVAHVVAPSAVGAPQVATSRLIFIVGSNLIAFALVAVLSSYLA